MIDKPPEPSRTGIFRRYRKLNRVVKWLYLIYLYFRLAVIGFYRKNGFTRASALAYSLLFAIIPLMASISLVLSKIYELNRYTSIWHFVSRIQEFYQARINIFLTHSEISELILKFLPYTTEQINDYITAFVHNAMTIGKIGTLVLLFTVFLLVGTLESIFNATWRIKKGRPFHKKIGMTVYILFLFTLTFSLSVKIGGLKIFEQYLLIKIPGKFISFCLLVVSFSLLYKLVPNIRVRNIAAATGGVLAAILYAFSRLGFKYYLVKTFAYSKIYGSLGLIPVFVISLYMLAFIVILGVEMTYVSQNYTQLYFGFKKKQIRKRLSA